MYASDMYNGIHGGEVYLVRFISCVGLHATWAAAVAIAIWHRRDWFQQEWTWGELAFNLFLVLGVPMVLHDLYDTLLKKDMTAGAITAAAASFAWLVATVEFTTWQTPESAGQLASG